MKAPIKLSKIFSFKNIIQFIISSIFPGIFSLNNYLFFKMELTNLNPITMIILTIITFLIFTIVIFWAINYITNQVNKDVNGLTIKIDELNLRTLKLERENKYLSKIIFLRTNPNENVPKDFESEFKNETLYLSSGALTKEDIIERKQHELNRKKRVLDYELNLIIDDFNKFNSPELTRPQIEKEVKEIYNEPFRHIQ